MSSFDDDETGFSESYLHFAYKTFFHDCPDGFCSKRKFLAFLRKSSVHNSSQKSTGSNVFIKTIVTRQNYRQSKKFFSMMFDIYDQNGDGQLDFNEYIYALSALTGANRSRTIETLYKFFDPNNQGYITQQEFNSRKKLAAQFLGRCNATIYDSLLYEQAFNAMDINKDGKISKEEFVRWHLQDHMKPDEPKPTKKRIKILKNISTLVHDHGHIKTSSLQQHENTSKTPINAWVETTINVNNNTNNNTNNLTLSPLSPSTIHVDRYLLKVFRRARNHFIQHINYTSNSTINSKRTTIGSQCDSGVFTSSSRTNFNDDIESNSLVDIDDDTHSQTDETNQCEDELLCQSLEVALMETLRELREERHKRSFQCALDDTIITSDQTHITRL